MATTDYTNLRPEDVFIGVMGVTGSGKSTFISTLCPNASASVGHSLRSATQEIAVYSFQAYNRTIHLIDTPGFDDTTKSDGEVLRELAYWLSASYGGGFRLTGLIYLHPITEVRMTGSASKNLRTIRKICGQQSMSSLVLATTMWEKVPPAEGDQREFELKNTPEFWGAMMEEGSQVFRFLGDQTSAMSTISYLLAKNSTTVLSLQAEMVDGQMTLDSTAAGREIESDMLNQRERLLKELEEKNREWNEAVAANNQAEMNEIAQEQQNWNSQIAAIDKDRGEMRTGLEQLIRSKAGQYKAGMKKKVKKQLGGGNQNLPVYSQVPQQPYPPQQPYFDQQQPLQAPQQPYYPQQQGYAPVQQPMQAPQQPYPPPQQPSQPFQPPQTVNYNMPQHYQQHQPPGYVQSQHVPQQQHRPPQQHQAKPTSEEEDDESDEDSLAQAAHGLEGANAFMELSQAGCSIM